jgi:hypothetical protein
MLTGKFLFTLLGMILAIFAICNTDMTSKPVVENFWMAGQFVPTGRPAVRKSNGEMVALPQSNTMHKDMMGSGNFFKTANFQAVLSPRMNSQGYGASIKYSLPDQKNLAVPCTPLSFGDMAKENYSQENYGCSSSGNCPPSCGKGEYGINKEIDKSYGLEPGYTNGNYQNVYDSLPGDKIMDGDIPNFGITTMDGNGDIEQLVQYSRIMPANTKSSSRLRAMGDPIRGDPYITPCAMGWFTPSVNLARDLHEGAMNVMTDYREDSSQAGLHRMIHIASGYTQTALGGSEDIKQLPAHKNLSQLSAGGSDINVTMFP